MGFLASFLIFVCLGVYADPQAEEQILGVWVNGARYPLTMKIASKVISWSGQAKIYCGETKYEVFSIEENGKFPAEFDLSNRGFPDRKYKSITLKLEKNCTGGALSGVYFLQLLLTPDIENYASAVGYDKNRKAFVLTHFYKEH